MPTLLANQPLPGSGGKFRQILTVSCILNLKASSHIPLDWPLPQQISWALQAATKEKSEIYG